MYVAGLNKQNYKFLLFQSKALGDTKLTVVAAETDVNSNAKLMAKFNEVINKINGYETPDCTS